GGAGVIAPAAPAADDVLLADAAHPLVLPAPTAVAPPRHRQRPVRARDAQSAVDDGGVDATATAVETAATVATPVATAPSAPPTGAEIAPSLPVADAATPDLPVEAGTGVALPLADGG
ncbi:MAG: hypothetical protein ACR2JV_07525, partial [Gaiellales bacterium]